MSQRASHSMWNSLEILPRRLRENHIICIPQKVFKSNEKNQHVYYGNNIHYFARFQEVFGFFAENVHFLWHAQNVAERNDSENNLFTFKSLQSKISLSGDQKSTFSSD